MGRRPLEIAMAAGMKVFISRAATVSDAVDAFLGGGLVEFGSEMACRGTSHGGCGGH
jgi:predicted Fe-Mo cluster-binding NifX family protein